MLLQIFRPVRRLMEQTGDQHTKVYKFTGYPGDFHLSCPCSKPSRAHMEKVEKDTVSGTLERVTFHNSENGFAVLQIKTPGKTELITLVGHIAVVNTGEYIDAAGRWQVDQRYGLQFKAETIQATPPATVEGVRRYLGSGLIHGIGPEYAKRLAEAFGDEVLEVIEKEPQKLTTVPGIGPKRKETILRSWKEQKAVRQIMLFLFEHGIGPMRAVRIWRTYGESAIDRIRSNPYCLANDVRGIGFQTADKIAQDMGVDPHSLDRARAGITFVLQELRTEGHAAYPAEDLLAKAKELLSIPMERLEEALIKEREQGKVLREEVNGVTWIYLAGLWHAETAVARILLRLQEKPSPLRLLDPDSAVSWIENKLSLSLSRSQREAVLKAIHNKVMVLTGGPGVGKTTIVRVITTLYDQQNLKAVLCAPTGRASKRLEQASGRSAKTIHRLLEADPSKGSFRRNRHNPLNAKLVVVDEASMVDLPLMRSLLSAVPADAAFLMVGDVDQLPSIGPGLVLSDVLDSGVVPFARLTEIFRQEKASQITVNAHLVNRGFIPRMKPPESLSDFYFVQAEDPEYAKELLLTLVYERIPARFGLHPVRDIQILSPMTRGALGTRSLNQTLQEKLNPRPASQKIQRFGSSFGPGDKVMQVVNDYNKEVFNGDIGFVRDIDFELGEVTVDFEEKQAKYTFTELEDLTPAYAITIHKSQGCEFEAIIVPVHTQHYVMLQRNLLYTAITRGRKLVVLLGSKRAVAIAARNEGTVFRYSALRQRLQGILPTGSG